MVEFPTDLVWQGDFVLLGHYVPGLANGLPPPQLTHLQTVVLRRVPGDLESDRFQRSSDLTDR